MGVGASRVMGMGDTGGTKWEGGGSNRQTRTNGGVIYYLNQATGGSIVMAVVVMELLDLARWEEGDWTMRR